MPINNLTLVIDGSHVIQSNRVRFLGIQLDCNLNWKSHVDEVCSKVSKTIGVLYKIMDFVPSYIIVNLYYRLIYPHLTYCNIVWGNTHPTFLNKLFILQKKAVRLLTSSDYRAHTSNLFQTLNILTIFDIYSYQLGVFMYKIDHNCLPSVFQYFFKLNSDDHYHFTRSWNKIHVSSINTEINRKSIVYSGVKFWNNLDATIKNALSLHTFTYHLKRHLLSNIVHYSNLF